MWPAISCQVPINGYSCQRMFMLLAWRLGCCVFTIVPIRPILKISKIFLGKSIQSKGIFIMIHRFRTAVQPVALRMRRFSDSIGVFLLWSAIILLYPLGGVIVPLSAVLLLWVCAVGSLPAVAASYVFFFLFDNMLPFPLLGGSLVRVLQLGILLRGGFFCLRNQLWPDRFTFWTGCLVALSSVVSVVTKGLQGDSVSFAVNMAVLLLMRMTVRESTAQLPVEERASAMDHLFRRLAHTYVASALLAVCFGVAYCRFYVLDAGAVVRFLGTHEPNFMAMFLDIALILAILLPPRAGKMLDALLLGVLLGGLFLTRSLTGLGIAGCMLVLCGFALARRKPGQTKEKVRGIWPVYLLRLVCGVAVAAVVSVGGMWFARRQAPKVSDIYALEASTGVAAQETPAYIPEAEYRALRAAGESITPHLLTEAQWKAYRQENGLSSTVLDPKEAEALLQDGFARWLGRIPIIGNRLYTALGYARLYGLDAATSGRWGLLTEKVRDFAAFPWWQQLIGRGPDVEKTYFPLVQNFGFSHNSYLDLFTGFGILGTLGLCWWFAHALRGKRFWGIPLQIETGAALSVVRIALLLHGATLSMYLNRVFLFFWLG